jgi:hypothetical protein
LVELFGQFVIDEILGEIHPMKTDFKIVDELEVFILTTVTQKVVLENLHFLSLLRDQFLEGPISGHWVFTLSPPFLQYFFPEVRLPASRRGASPASWVSRGYGGLFSSRQAFAQWLWDGTKAHHNNVGLWCRPGALNTGDGGGKEEGRLLGCGLEKRPPYPR